MLTSSDPEELLMVGITEAMNPLKEASWADPPAFSLYGAVPSKIVRKS